MGAKHKRTWSVVREGAIHPSGYRASIAKLESDIAASAAFNVVYWLIAIFTWLLTVFDGIFGFEPRYRVLVGRAGTDEVVGVREARTLHQADQQLAEVDAILAISSETAARRTFDLNF